MALTDPHPTASAFDPARLPQSVRDRTQPAAALAQLAVLRDEARHTLTLSQLLDSAPQACLSLMLFGGFVLLQASWQDGAPLGAAFAWSLWVLTGVLAMTVVYIRGFARHPALHTLEAAASELRKFLLYTGLAWGLGAFLVLPDQPNLALILVLAVLPGWAITLIFRDEKAAGAFSAPAALMTISASIIRSWPHALETATLITLAWSAGFFMLHRANRRRVSRLALG
jgi:hypothetical protein